MIRRFMLFLFGAGIGSIFVYITLIKGREGVSFWESYFPEGRVKQKTISGLNLTDSTTLCLLQCHEITQNQFITMIKEADIDFEKSAPHSNPKTYFYTSENQIGSQVIFEIQLADTVATLNYFHHLTVPKDCDCTP